jgi:hypothetical protein
MKKHQLVEWVVIFHGRWIESGGWTNIFSA